MDDFLKIGWVWSMGSLITKGSSRCEGTDNGHSRWTLWLPQEVRAKDQHWVDVDYSRVNNSCQSTTHARWSGCGHSPP